MVAARDGIPDHQIQALGRWTNSAYLSYIWTPAESLSQLSKQLSRSAARWQLRSDPSWSLLLHWPCPIHIWIGLLVQNIHREHVRSWAVFHGDLHSWYDGWPSETFLVGGRIAISVQLGRHPGHLVWYVCPLFCLSGWAGELVLGRLWGFGPSSTLCTGPSFSKHFGGEGLVAAAHRVVMDTLSVRLGWFVASPSFLGTIPQAYLLLMSLNVAKCNLGYKVKRKTMLASSISQGSGVGWPGVLCRGPTWLTARFRMSSHLHFVIALRQITL